MSRQLSLGDRAFYNQTRLTVSSLLKRIDNFVVPEKKGEVRLFAIARNEELRLPYFMKYYFNKQVDRIFLIDNGSQDNTVNIALSTDKVHIFHTDADYKDHWYWMEYLLDIYGSGNWCLVVDIDELLYYPYADQISIRDLCNFLSLNNFTAFKSLLLDVYSDKPLHELRYSAGDNPLLVCPFFDAKYYTIKANSFDRYAWCYFETEMFYGGMRERVFGKNLPYHLTKISPFVYSKGTYLTQGMHAIAGAKVSNLQGVVFHTKFLQDFVMEVQIESKREQHYAQAVLYKIFERYINQTADVNFWFPGSTRFQDADQLINLGLMKSSTELNAYTNLLTKERNP